MKAKTVFNETVKELKSTFNKGLYFDTSDKYRSLMSCLFMVTEEIYHNRGTYAADDFIDLIQFRPGRCQNGVSEETKDDLFYLDFIQTADTDVLIAFGEWLHNQIETLPEDKKY